MGETMETEIGFVVVVVVGEGAQSTADDDCSHEIKKCLMDKVLTYVKLLLMDEQFFFFFEVQSTPGEDAVKIAEITTNNLEYYIKLTDKALAGYE